MTGRPRRAAAPTLAGALAVALAACGGGAGLPAPTVGPIATPISTPSIAVQTTIVQLQGALRAAGLTLRATQVPVRPAEPASFAGVARWPFQVVLPDDPTGGLFVVYEFPDVALAAIGAADLAGYVASGPGRVQYPTDVRFVLRQVGTTIVLFAWSPASSSDPRTEAAANALATVGSEVAIPRG